MSTASQITANQLNAQSSAGPRTVDGKSVVSKNDAKKYKQYCIIKGEVYLRNTHFL